jgi:threonylcarbamoyladenosine tRNA methylthiotransferase MtaB
VSAGFHIENFGCRAARADGEAIGERLRAAGHCAEQLSEASVVVVNTCSVTEEADREARAFIRRAHRRNPAARIVVTGCYAQRAPEEVAALPGVAAVVGNSHKAWAPEIVRRASESASQRVSQPANGGLVDVRTLMTGASTGTVPVWVDDQFAHSFLEEAQVVPGAQTRPNLKIQEGCANRCTFCVIPQTRGGSRSLSAEKVLEQVRGFVAAGGNELVLSGINLGRWGRDLADRFSLAGLVRRIFAETELPRLRLSSIEPMDWDGELIGLMREFGGSAGSPPTGLRGWGAGRLARHAHLPLQSGSDAVLRRMHRRYRPWHYADKVAELFRAAGPELTLGADVMVGFPGETEREFAETRDFIASLRYGYLHLFPFSPRPGTRAWQMHEAAPVPEEAVEERMAELRRLRDEKIRAHRGAFAGRKVECITLNTPEPERRGGWSAALTENFLPIRLRGALEANQMLRAVVMGMRWDGELEGVVLSA